MLRFNSSSSSRLGLTLTGTVLLFGSGYAALGRAPQHHYVPLPEANVALIKGKPGPLSPFPTRLSSRLPYDVNVSQVRQLTRSGKIIAAHRHFDILSWQAFIALNWPARSDGSPDSHKSLSDRYNSTPRVWAHWINATQVFKPKGAKPDPFPTASSWLRQKNHTLYIPRYKAAWRNFKKPKVVARDSLQAFSGPLVDQNGKWVHYQVMINKEEYDYFVANTLYNLEGQARFASQKRINLPMNQGQSKHGTIEVKLAWKQLGKGDNPARFFHTPAKIRNADTGKYETVEVGLVGMHIAMRTQSSPQWIWSTFEHIDNAPDQVGDEVKLSKKSYSFYNANSSEKVNQLPERNAVLDPNTELPVNPTPSQTPTSWFEGKTTKPVQVTRVVAAPQPPNDPEINKADYHEMHDVDNALRPSTEALNLQVQKLLKGQKSVFQFYKLIGTQWPLDPKAPAFGGGEGSAPQSITRKMPGRVIPVLLCNSTMETYFQIGKQAAGPLEEDARLEPGAVTDHTKVIGTESCVGCHYSAGMCVGFRNKNGARVPIFGKNDDGGQNGNGGLSWLLQIEARSIKD